MTNNWTFNMILHEFCEILCNHYVTVRILNHCIISRQNTCSIFYTFLRLSGFYLQKRTILSLKYTLTYFLLFGMQDVQCCLN